MAPIIPSGPSKVRGALFAALLILLSVLFLASKRPVGDYSDPGEPSYEGKYADAPARFDGTLRVVSWNLHYGDELAPILTALGTSDELRDADIVLLQELNVEGAETLARELGYNYVHFPSAFDRERRKEYGNAILSRWPLREAKKIILPGWLPGWIEDRNAARAITTIDGRDILVYSAHLDNLWMDSQGALLTDAIEAQPRMTILGGDFNTWRAASLSSLERDLERTGMQRLAEGTGYTFRLAGAPLALDHIFSPEGLAYRAGVFRQTDASDHFPIWADIIIGED